MPRRPMPLWSDPGEVDDALDGAELPKDIVERRAALRPEGERAAHKVVAVAGIGVQLQLRECAVLFPREADELPDAQLRAELAVFCRLWMRTSTSRSTFIASRMKA